MNALHQAFFLLAVVAFATFVVTLSAVSVRAACGEGPTMRKSFRPRPWKARR